MNKATRELISAAENTVRFMESFTTPRSDEFNAVCNNLKDAVIKVKTEEKRPGSLVLVELGDGRRRITATVETADKYLSRAGWKNLHVQATIVYSQEVPDLESARKALKRTLKLDTNTRGQGMDWCQLSRADLTAVITKVVNEVSAQP
jgi:hypothetical protein